METIHADDVHCFSTDILSEHGTVWQVVKKKTEEAGNKKYAMNAHLLAQRYCIIHLLYIPGQLKDLERHKDVSTSAPS
jgi:hypothetical protein